jgi:hypothetical protein
VSDRLPGQRATEEREEGRVISITIYGKVRLYIPLYIYIVVSLGFWWKGQIQLFHCRLQLAGQEFVNSFS